MNLDQKMRESLQQAGKEIVIPPELKEKVMCQILMKKAVKPQKTIKKRLITSVLTAALLLPTSAFAYESLLADGVYESFENVKKHVAAATIEGYMTLNAKLMKAKGELGEEEYETFKESLHIITDTKLKYGDKYGNTDFDRMSSGQVAEVKKASMKLQPFFDQLNGDRSSKELLSPKEYEQYIEALMIYEKVLAQEEVDTNKGPVEVEKLSKELQGVFQEAKDVIEYVNKKQQAIKEQESMTPQ